MKQKMIVVFVLSVTFVLLGINIIYWSRMFIVINTYYNYKYPIQTAKRYVKMPSNTLTEENNYGNILLIKDIKNINDTDDISYTDEITTMSDSTENTKTAVSDSGSTPGILAIDYNKITSTYHPRNMVLDLQVLLDITDIKVSEDNIFFVETKCATRKTAAKYNETKGLSLDIRQSCAVESTSLANLDKEVYLLHSCPLGDDFYEHSPAHARRLLSYPNVHVVSLNMTEVFAGSPVQELYERGLLETSSFPLEHTSDVLRYTLLWKFGGTYSDLDVVTIRSFADLKSNWAGQQDDVLIASGVMNFSPTEEGHAVVEAALGRMRRHFNGGVWGANGPAIITATVLSQCNVTSVTEAMRNCQANFTVLKRDIFYPIYYPSYGLLFDDKIGPKLVEQLKSSAYSVHIWNKMSHGKIVRVGSTQAYALLAKEYCPEVYRHSGNEF